MHAQRLGRVLSGLEPFHSTLFCSYVHCLSGSSFLPKVPATCFARPNPHLSYGRSHSLMSTNMSEALAVSSRKVSGKRGRKTASTAIEIMEARRSLLVTLIAATEGRTDLKPKQTARRTKHICEKANIEKSIEAYVNAQTSVAAAAASVQLPTSKSTSIPTTIPTNSMSLRSTNALVTQTDAGIVATATTATNSIRKLLAEPTFTSINHVTQHSIIGQGLQMRLPLRPAKHRKKFQETDAIVPPSAASGGVPEPSPMYMSLAVSEPQIADVPQHLLLVIDLNGTLLYRPNRNTPSHFVERPSTQQFLKYTLANFSVMIWSSARRENVDRMCHKLFPKESRQKLVAVWGRDRLGLSAADSHKRVQVYKRLEKVWNDPQTQRGHPLANEGKGWHQGNTVLIDDSVEKSRSEPYNFLEVPEFTGDKGEDPNILKELAEYLAILRLQANVSNYILRNPLVRRKLLVKQPVITSSTGSNQ